MRAAVVHALDESPRVDEVDESFEQIEKREIDARLVFDFRH